MRLLAAGALCISLTACESFTTITLGPNDGVLPFWYEEWFAGLPASFADDVWPDGNWEYHLNEWQTVRIGATSHADGRRDISFRRQVLVADAPLSVFYRDQVGSDTIASIRGVDLELLELRLDSVDFDETGMPELSVNDQAVPLDGSSASLPRELIGLVRDKLLAGEPILLPFTMTFHLDADALDALPSDIHIFLRVQPFLQVDVLKAL